MGCSARRPRTADGGPSGSLRNVPLPRYGGPAQAEGSERAGKGAETTQPASRMNRPARTLTRDLVRRRHPTGASPSRRNAPGRTLSPMPSEQKGAYGGHLALVLTSWFRPRQPNSHSTSAPNSRTADGCESPDG